MEHTPQSSERQDRIRYAFHFGIALIVALVLYGALVGSHPQPPAGEWRPAPDPPMVDNSVKVEILSNNSLFSNNCFGSCSK